MRLNLDYDSEVFPVADDHMVLRLSSEGDCARVLVGGPWFVTGQLMVLDKWEPDFLPRRKPIQKTVVWLRLLELPLEYWVPSAIMAVVAEVGNPISSDNFTDLLRKKCYVRVRVVLDASKPLKPSVLI